MLHSCFFFKTFKLFLATLLAATMFIACGKKAALKNSVETISLSSKVRLELVKVMAGTFEMSKDYGVKDGFLVPHWTTLRRDFFIGRTEVTQAQWNAVMGSNSSEFKGDDLPVENVSWHDAMVFCEKLNDMGKAPKGWKFTLPTETQWEYAARGGNKSEGFKYSGSNSIEEVAWYLDNSENKTHPVKQKKANELGLYDMSGNVCEWCLDDWQDKSDKLIAEFERKNDQGDLIRACRGGCYAEDWSCPSVVRSGNKPGNRSSRRGFRLVLVSIE